MPLFVNWEVHVFTNLIEKNPEGLNSKVLRPPSCVHSPNSTFTVGKSPKRW